MGLLGSIIRLLVMSKGRGKKLYLIEIRLWGPIKKDTEQLIREVSRKFRVLGFVKRRPVPHMTFYGPFSTSKEGEVVNKFKLICGYYISHRKELYFEVEGFRAFGGVRDKVITYDIKPSPKLQELRRLLSRELASISNAQPWDFSNDFEFHVSISFRDIGAKSTAILDYLKKRYPLKKYKQNIIRFTLLKKGLILYEFDFYQQKLINRRLAKSGKYFRETLRLLNSSDK